MSKRIAEIFGVKKYYPTNELRWVRRFVDVDPGKRFGAIRELPLVLEQKWMRDGDVKWEPVPIVEQR